MEFSRFFQTSRPRPLMSSSSSYSFVFLFILFIMLIFNCQLSGGSGNSDASTPRKRVTRQLGLGGFGGFGTSLLANLQPQQQYNNNRRQPSAEMNFFQTMMSLNFDMTEVIAMYRNVTAVAETPGCLGHCRTPMALWVVQSFYPCYSLKKADCPKGLVCCMQDPSHRITSANTVHDTRIKYSSPSLAASVRDRGQGNSHYQEDYSAESSPSSGSSQPLKSASVTPSAPTQSTTLFDEEYFKNNFIQDEIPE